jgi:hypothetical protein
VGGYCTHIGWVSFRLVHARWIMVVANTDPTYLHLSFLHIHIAAAAGLKAPIHCSSAVSCFGAPILLLLLGMLTSSSHGSEVTTWWPLTSSHSTSSQS